MCIHAVGPCSAAEGLSFSRVSGGLDAGVTIYSKRVDCTYKQAFETLTGIGPSDGGEGRRLRVPFWNGHGQAVYNTHRTELAGQCGCVQWLLKEWQEPCVGA